MNAAELLARLQSMISERYGIEAAQLQGSAHIRDIGLDSLHVVEIMLDLESELGVSLRDLSMPPNPTLDDVAAVILKNVAAKA